MSNYNIFCKRGVVLLAMLLTLIGGTRAAQWIDVTKFIVNPSFDGDDVHTGWSGTAFNAVGPKENAEHFSKIYDTYQVITGLKEGLYRVSLSAFYRMGNANEDYSRYTSGDYEEFQHGKLYATSSDGDFETSIVPLSSAALQQSLGGGTSTVGNGGWWGGNSYFVPNNMEAAHYWFEAGYYLNQLECTVGSDGVLQIGIRKYTTLNNDWTCLDNWKLEMWGEMVKATGIKLNKTSISATVGEIIQLSATITPADATITQVEWKSSNESVATVDKNGVVTIHDAGKSKITATTTDDSNLSATCTITATYNESGLKNLIITELQSENIDQFMDPSWNYGGWVEFYNPSASAVSLKGCWLSDDRENLKLIHITEPIAIPANGYKALWFDHHDQYYPTQVDMKLDVEGGAIYLSDNSGNLLTSLVYPTAISRASYARVKLDEDGYMWSSTPTPEAPNDGMTFSYVQLPAPVVDLNSQIFGASLNVCVNIPAGTTLRYTTDGTTPTLENGQVSTDGLFRPSETTVYRFRLFADNYLPSPVVTRSYILEDKTFALPVMSIATDWNNLYSQEYGIFTKGNGNGRPGNGKNEPCNWNMDWERPINVEYINTEGEMVINQETAMERCGGWSRAWTPFSFKVKANKQYELQNFLPYDFFEEKPYRKHKTLQVRNGGNDNTCRFKDPALQEIVFRSGLDVDCQGYQPVMHYFNGTYAGVINVREPNNKHYVYANYGLDDDEIDQFEMSPDSGYIQKCGTYASMQQWYDLAAACSDDRAYDAIKEMVDIDEYCNYMAVQLYLGNWDWPQNNVKGWKPIMQGGKYRFILFDMDGSLNTTDAFNTFANKQYYTFDPLYGQPIDRYYNKEIEFVTIFKNMLQNAEFRKQFIDTYCLVTGSVFEPERCTEIINELANRVSNSQNIYNPFYGAQSTPWSTANSLISGLSASRQSTMYGTLQNYSPLELKNQTAQSIGLCANIPEARLLVNGLPVPTNRFSGKLFAPITLRAQAPAGYKFLGWKMTEGTGLTETEYLMSTESTWKYYDKGSLDGEEWYTTSYDDSAWGMGQSPLGYFVGGSRFTNTYLDYGDDANNKYPTYYFRNNLYLDEIPEGKIQLNYIIDDGFIIYINGTEAGRYNMPSGKATYNTYATSYAKGNPDSGTLDLDASLFHSGNNTIAVEVHNNNANSTDVHWECSISQSVTHSDGIIVCTDEEYKIPEGNMVLIACYDEMSAQERQEAGLSSAPVVINEVSAGNSIYVNDYFKKDDWVELYNTTDQDIDLQGMYLTDRSAKPDKYQITAKGTQASTIIPAHGYKIIWCSKRDTQNELHANFKLDNEDGTVIRIMAQDRSWADSLVYCAHNGDQTVGRYPDGGSAVYLMPQPTIAKSNLLNTYAKVWEYVSPEDTTTNTIPTLASRTGGMSIAYVGEQLLVKSEDDPFINVSVFTASGALVMSQSLYLETGHERVGLSTLPAGIYVARARDREGNECATKFAKK
ncbi:MAG: CotH kinase family protein [Bacteroidaceae bacterium]|nr:CotH kinase family protein [Bacteroidaceae bacterium]